MNRYREYIIGGPMDGKDALDEFPHGVPFGIRCDEHWTREDYEADPAMDPELIGQVKNSWLYMPHRFTLGGIVIQFWSDERLMSREVIALRVAELIFAPHMITTPQTETEGAPQ
jgi:hypothetical protein